MGRIYELIFSLGEDTTIGYYSTPEKAMQAAEKHADAHADDLRSDARRLEDKGWDQ